MQQKMEMFGLCNQRTANICFNYYLNFLLDQLNNYLKLDKDNRQK